MSTPKCSKAPRGKANRSFGGLRIRICEPSCLVCSWIWYDRHHRLRWWTSVHSGGVLLSRPSKTSLGSLIKSLWSSLVRSLRFNVDCPLASLYEFKRGHLELGDWDVYASTQLKRHLDVAILQMAFGHLVDDRHRCALAYTGNTCACFLEYQTVGWSYVDSVRDLGWLCQHAEFLHQ